MNNPISERVRKVKPSATIAISSKAMEMRSAGINVISMSAGEPDFDTPVSYTHLTLPTKRIV